MGDSSSSADGSSEESSPVLANEKGSRNKRKFVSDLPVNVPVGESTLPLTEFPRYEMIEEKFRDVLHELGSMIERSKDTVDEQDVEELQEADWEDPIACQLEDLLANNLFATYDSAVKQVIESGYTEEVAEWAVLNSSRFYGSKDAVSNVVDGALALLKKEKEFKTPPKHSLFEGLQSLVDYTLLEMIHVLREVRPGLTIAEAMWCLLISDLNLLNACLMDGPGPSDGSSGKEAPGENPSTGQSDSSKLDGKKELHSQNSQPENPVSGPHQSTTSKSRSSELARPGKESYQQPKGKFVPPPPQGPLPDDKLGASRKMSSSANSKRDLLRQKTFQFEKNYKGRMSKGAFKAKVAAWGSMVLDKSLKSESGSSGVLMKSTNAKLTASAGSNTSPAEPNANSATSTQSGVPAPVKDTMFVLPAVNSKSPTQTAQDPDPSPKGEKINVSNPPKITDYYAAIPFDENLQKYVPRDDKDEVLLMLVPHKQALEKELQSWRDWANEKVMQAARKLGKDQGELKMLRQEREEIEKFKKDKQNLEDSTMKRLSEMEYALSNATGQIEVANCTVRRLEEENRVLHKEMEAARLKAIGSANSLEEVIVREQEAIKKCQSWEGEKGLLLEEQTKLRRKIAEMEIRVEKAKRRRDQFKVLLKQEEKEIQKLAAQLDALRSKRQEEEAQLKAEEDRIKQAAEMNKQKCEQDIKDLQKTISQLRLESNKSKIAALSVGYGNTTPGMQLPKITKRLAVFQDNFGGDSGVKPERECVMCMTDEISVIFLPCAHQVLCGQCSDLHEKQGMNDCPSCRTTIQKRISVTYRAD